MGTLLAEKRIGLAALARREDVTESTVWRWAGPGCRGVRLETFTVGARRFTTEEAYRRFIEQTTAAAPLGGSA
jgi:hypothetical protein